MEQNEIGERGEEIVPLRGRIGGLRGGENAVLNGFVREELSEFIDLVLLLLDVLLEVEVLHLHEVQRLLQVLDLLVHLLESLLLLLVLLLEELVLAALPLEVSLGSEELLLDLAHAREQGLVLQREVAAAGV